MDKRKVRQYEARLTEQRNALLGMVERTEDYGREADRDVSQDPADKASNSYTKELLFSQSTNERNTLRLIEEALDRCLPTAEARPSRLHESIRYSVLAPGKRLRPSISSGIRSFQAERSSSVACAERDRLATQRITSSPCCRT